MASPATIGIVEVLEPADKAYYRATLIDVDGKEYCVKYIGEDELCWVEASRVRQVPVAMTPEEHAKWAGTVVEGVAVEAGFDDETIDGLTSWSEGVVQKIKGDFYVITFPESNDLETNEVVEKDKIRPAYGHQMAKFDKKVFPVPPELQEDIQLTEDLLPMMAKNAGLVLLKLSSDGSELMALGSAFALDTAFVLINMHFVKAPQLAKFAHRANSLQGRMPDANGSMMKGESVVFNTPQAYVGTMIGYRGSNIKRVQEMEGIIRVDVRNDGAQSSVTIVATDKEQAEAARASLEVVAEEVEVEEWDIGWIIGKKGQTINEMQGMSGCRISVIHKGEKPVVEVVGTKTCVDKGRALVAYTVESAQEQRQKEVMIHKLSGELRSMGVGEAGGGTTISKGRGRGRSMAGDVISFPGLAAAGGKDVAPTQATSPSVQGATAAAATPVPSSLPTRGRGRGAGKPATATATATPAAPPTAQPSSSSAEATTTTTTTPATSTLPAGRGGASGAGAGRGRAVTAPRKTGTAGSDATAQSSAGAGAAAPPQADPPQVRGDLAVHFVGGGMTVLPGMAIGGVPMMATGIFVPEGATLEGVMEASAGRGRGRGRSMADPGKAAGAGQAVGGGDAAGQGGAGSGGGEEDKAGKGKKKKKDKGKKEAFEDAVEPGQEGNKSAGGDAPPEVAKVAASKPKQQKKTGKGGGHQLQGQGDAGAAGGEVEPSEEQGQPTEAPTVAGGGKPKQQKKQGKGKPTEQQSQPQAGAVPPQPSAVDQDAAAAAIASKKAAAAEKAAAAAAKNTANQKAAAAAQKAAAAAAKEAARAKDVGGGENVEEKQGGGKAAKAKPQKNQGQPSDVLVVASTGENADGDAKTVGGGSEKKEGKGKGKGKGKPPGKGGAAAKHDKDGMPQPVKEDDASSETKKQECQPSGGSCVPAPAAAAAASTSSAPAPVPESAAPAQ